MNNSTVCTTTTTTTTTTTISPPRLSYREQRDRPDDSRSQEYIGLFDLGYIIRRQGTIAEKNRDNFEAEELYKCAIELGNIYALNNLAIFYEQNYYSLSLIEKTYHRAIDAHEDSDPIYNLADFYKNRRNFKKMVKYLKMAVEKDGDIECILLLAIYYEKNNNKRNANKYFKMLFDNENAVTADHFNIILLFDEIMVIVAYGKNKGITEENKIFKYIMYLYNKSEKIIIYNTKMTLLHD